MKSKRSSFSQARLLAFECAKPSAAALFEGARRFLIVSGGVAESSLTQSAQSAPPRAGARAKARELEKARKRRDRKRRKMERKKLT